MLNPFPFPGLSIQKRLPLLICILLLGVILAFGYTSYLGVKNATLSAAKERLNALTGQISSMFQQFSTAMLTSAHETANQPSIKKYLQSNGKDSIAGAQQTLDKAKLDSTIPLVELFNANRVRVLASMNNGASIHIDRNDFLPPVPGKPVFAEIGKLYREDKKMYYPITVAVADGRQTLGYLVKWRMLVTTPQAIEQFSQLIGSGGALYFGNDDSRFWTNGLIPIPPPPVDIKNVQQVILYKGPGGDPVMASAQYVAGTRWLTLVALSQKTVTETASRFLYWIIFIGVALVFAGIVLAWLMSRNITKPLKNLTDAACAIAEGNYDLQVKVDRKDELGKLAEAFNSMSVKVRNTQHDLEKKVQDRTAELESAIKELEAFSYSVSHDLRGPLRIINGYTNIVLKDHGTQLDDEAKRMLGIITNNTLRMGQLIDDLLNLSKLARTELTIYQTDMNIWVKAAIEEQLPAQTNHVDIKIGPLIPAWCDSNLIRQVWVNLIGNAVKFSRNREHSCIEINSDERLNEIVYSVKDNGVGFDMAYAHKLFAVFQRLHNFKEFEGTGVGLTLVQRIVNRHGGRVWAESELNKGACFYFSLPKIK